MLFKQRFWAGIADGSITLTFRRWKRPQVVAGNSYRTPAGLIQVTGIHTVDPAGITAEDAVHAGFPGRDELLAELRGDPSTPLYRVAFHATGDTDPRDELANNTSLSNDDVADIQRRLARLDNTARHGHWTASTLAAISSNPGLRAGDLAALLQRDKDSLKTDIRKLKNLGLTLSLETGYRLSPRGEHYLRLRPRD